MDIEAEAHEVVDYVLDLLLGRFGLHDHNHESSSNSFKRLNEAVTASRATCDDRRRPHRAWPYAPPPPPPPKGTRTSAACPFRSTARDWLAPPPPEPAARDRADTAASRPAS